MIGFKALAVDVFCGSDWTIRKKCLLMLTIHRNWKCETWKCAINWYVADTGWFAKVGLNLIFNSKWTGIHDAPVLRLLIQFPQSQKECKFRTHATASTTFPYFVLICVKNYLRCLCGNFAVRLQIEPLGFRLVFTIFSRILAYQVWSTVTGSVFAFVSRLWIMTSSLRRFIDIRWVFEKPGNPRAPFSRLGSLQQRSGGRVGLEAVIAGYPNTFHLQLNVISHF